MKKFSRSWWLDLRERTWRQIRQATIPALVAASAATTATSGDPFTWLGLVTTIVGVSVVTFLRALTGWRAEENAPGLEQTIDRGTAAGAGVMLGLTGAVLQYAVAGDFAASLAAARALDWTHVGTAFAAAVALSVFDSRVAPTGAASPLTALPAVDPYPYSVGEDPLDFEDDFGQEVDPGTRGGRPLNG